jgi:eukaryotic-like serine/threonine-protein kinase
MNPERWALIERIFNSAVELPPAERTAFLEQACRSDESLRKEVEHLLANAAETQVFMKSNALNVAARALAEDQAGFSDLTGQTVLHYRMIKKIGAGGMGEVYIAEDKNLDRQVAVKVLPDIFRGDSERLARLMREAKLLASNG